MKKIGLGLVLGFCWYMAGAQSGTSSLLWEISGNGLSQPSYLFGTFHIVCKKDFTITSQLQEKLLSTRQLYGELDMDAPGQEMQLALKMIMKDSSLPQLVSDTDYRKMDERFRKITGMPLTMFNNFLPFVPMSLAVTNMVPCSDKVQPETEFMKIAKEHNIEVLGLETIQEQVDVINSQPRDSMVSQFRSMLLNYDSSRQAMQHLVDVYNQRNIDSIYAYMKSEDMSQDFETELLVKRNRKWVPLMVQAMQQKPSFFAVGAGHLGGPDGVVSLLRKQHYLLRPVNY